MEAVYELAKVKPRCIVIEARNKPVSRSPHSMRAYCNGRILLFLIVHVSNASMAHVLQATLRPHFEETMNVRIRNQ